MARYFVTEPIREIPWYEYRGAPLDDGGVTASQEQAREQAYSLMHELNERIESAAAYRCRK